MHPKGLYPNYGFDKRNITPKLREEYPRKYVSYPSRIFLDRIDIDLYYNDYEIDEIIEILQVAKEEYSAEGNEKVFVMLDYKVEDSYDLADFHLRMEVRRLETDEEWDDRLIEVLSQREWDRRQLVERQNKERARYEEIQRAELEEYKRLHKKYGDLQGD